MSSKTQTDNFTVIWRIETFGFNCCKPGEVVESSCFTIVSLENTRWQLALYPRGDPFSDDTDHISIALDRKCLFHEIKDIVIDVTVSILAEGGEVCFSHRKSACVVLLYSGIIISKFIKRDLLLPKHLPRDTLTIVCKIGLSDKTFGSLYLSCRDSLSSLSNDFASLYESKQFSDLTLRPRLLNGSHGDSVQVHKIFMFARWANFASVVGLQSCNDYPTNSSIEVTSTSAFSSFIRYLYTGKVTDSETTLEFYNFLENQRLSHVQKLMETLPTEISLRTTMNIERKTLTWNIVDINSWKQDTLPIIRMIHLEEISAGDLILSLSLKPKYGEEWLEISFSFLNFEIERVFLQCKAYVLHDNVQLNNLTVGHLFEHDEVWHFPYFISKRELSTRKKNGQTPSIVCELILCAGPRIIKCETSCTSFETGSRSISDLGTLCRDLNQCFRSHLGRFNDITLSVVDSSMFAHKAILSARSEFFKQIFEQSLEAPKSTSLNMNRSGLEILLEYIYCGAVNKTINREIVEDLSQVLEKCSLPLLKAYLEIVCL